MSILNKVMENIEKNIQIYSTMSLLIWVGVMGFKTLSQFNWLTVTLLIPIIGYGYFGVKAFMEYYKTTKVSKSKPCGKCGKNKVKK